MSENINHPDHYKTGNYECIEVMKEIFGEDAVKDFCKLNAFKYLWRSDRKNGNEDLLKAKWYLDTYLLSELLNDEDLDDPDDDDDPDEEDDEDEEEIDGSYITKYFGHFTDAIRKAFDAVAEMDDPESEVSKRFKVFKDLKDGGYKDEVAFYYAFKDEVEDEQ